MKRKWFELVGEDGNALTLATAVSVEVEDVDMLRDDAFAKVSSALPTNVITPNLTVFANRAAFATKQKLEEDSPIDLFGGSIKEALIVQAPQRIDSQPHYFITREPREQVRKAVFQLVDPAKANTGNGMGVFFGPTLAVTCDHNLTDEHFISAKSFIPPWNGSPDDLEVRDDLVFASLRLGIDDYQEGFKNKL
ncbi:Crinkler (CRN) [Phytophthora megakarya]|uniref:Crinkler (CRN) n=1 Tax=Phytophthora megakarya TaxID=4795 RepID=A0A225UZB4_9STRA|nr:Crinkler (CRN) [Phytophthora megakarya]